MQDLVRAAEREFLIIERPQKRERTALKERKKKFRAEENRKTQKELAQIFFAGVENKNRFQKGKKLDSKTEEKQQGVSLRKTNVRFVKSLDIGKINAPRKI